MTSGNSPSISRSRIALISLVFASQMIFYTSFAQKPVRTQFCASGSEIEVVSGVYLRGNAPIYTPIHYQRLIKCLSWHESRDDPGAVGKAGEIGILQFRPRTFQEFCVKRYGLQDDIHDSDIQQMCADKMIRDGYLRHWTTARFCR